MDEEKYNQLPFLYVLVERRFFAFVTSKYRKHTFTGLYFNWGARVKLYVPRDIRNHTTYGHSKLLDSAICEHLNAINSCAVNHNNECFGVLH